MTSEHHSYDYVITFNFWTEHVGRVLEYIIFVIWDTWAVRFNYELNFALHSFYGFMCTYFKVTLFCFYTKNSLTLLRHWWSLFWNNISSPIFDDIWAPKATKGNTELCPKSFWLQTPQALTLSCKLHAICLRSPIDDSSFFALCVCWK